MKNLSDRVESAVTKIEDSSDIAEKFADASAIVEFNTPKGLVKPIGLLQQEAEAAIQSMAAFNEETFVASTVYDGTQKVYFVDSGVVYTPVSYPYTAGTSVSADVTAGTLMVLQGLTVGDTGNLDNQIPKNSDLHDVLSRINVIAKGTTIPRSLEERAADTINVKDEDSFDNALSLAFGKGSPIDATSILTDLEIKVPSQIPTLQEAVDLAFMISVRSGQSINILMDINFKPTSGVAVKNGDYSKISISAADAVVYLDSTFNRDEDFIYAENAGAPTLNCLVNATGYCANGYFCNLNSKGKVNLGCGVDYAGEYGCYARGASTISADRSFFRFASYQKATGEGSGSKAAAGILAWGAIIDAEGADTSDSQYYGAQAAAGGSLNFRSGKSLRCYSYGIRGTNAGYVNARAADVSGSGHGPINIAIRAYDGSIVHAAEILAVGCKIAAYAEHCSAINLKDAVLTGCTDTAIVCLSGGKVSAYNADLSGSSKGIRALNGGEVIAWKANLNNCTDRAVQSFNGALVNITEASVNNNVSDVVLYANAGKIVGRYASLQNNGQVLADAREGGSINIARANVTGHSVGVDIVNINLGAYINVIDTGLTDAEFNKNSNNYTRDGIIVI